MRQMPCPSRTRTVADGSSAAIRRACGPKQGNELRMTRRATRPGCATAYQIGALSVVPKHSRFEAGAICAGVPVRKLERGAGGVVEVGQVRGPAT